MISASKSVPAPGRFDFGLSEAQEQRAARLHRDCIVVDAMCGHPGGASIFEADIDPAVIEEAFPDVSGPAALAAGIFAPYYLAAEKGDETIRRWWRQSGISVGVNLLANTRIDEFSTLKRAVAWFDRLDWIANVTTVREIRENKRRGVVSLWGYEQPTWGGLPNQLSAIERGYRIGVRTLMLTYNRADYVGQGCTERFDGGLSMYGLEVVRKCNDLGIVIDTSHCSRRTTLDACQFSRTPVLANHTCARALFDHARAKSDEELEAIAGTGGVIGIVTVPFFLGRGTQTIEATLDHIDYVVRRVGVDHVGIGTDWPLQGPRTYMTAALSGVMAEIGFRAEDQIDPASTLIGFTDYRDMPNITRGLIRRGYSDLDVAKILGENFLRVYERVCG